MSIRVLPDGTPLRNELLLALPDAAYARVADALTMVPVVVGQTVQESGEPVVHVFFPNSGVFSVLNEMRNGDLVEVATIGREGMLGVSVFLGDPSGSGRTLQQVPDGDLPALAAQWFVDEATPAGPFRDLIARYAQAHLLQVMQCTACNALHNVEQRCSRWLLQTQDRAERDEFMLKHEFLAAMLGVQRPTVTIVLGTLQQAGLISTRYGRIRVLDRPGLKAASCECYDVIRAHFIRLGF